MSVLLLIFPATGAVGETLMNLSSSRSHAIFTATIEQSDKGPDGQQHIRMGKLHLVDLAVGGNFYIEQFKWAYLQS